MRKRTSAGLAAVDALGPGTILSLLLVAVAALAWAHGLAALQWTMWLIRCAYQNASQIRNSLQITYIMHI